MTRLQALSPALLAGLALLATTLGCAADSAAKATQVGAAYHVAAAGDAGKGRGDYLPAHNWKIAIDGVLVGGFKEVSGLETAEFKDGDDPITHKRPGKTKFKNIVLKRGFVADPALLAWYKEVSAGKVSRKSGSIILHDRESNEVYRYDLSGAAPLGLAAKDAGYDVTLVEELTLEVENVLRTRHDTVKNAIGNIR